MRKFGLGRISGPRDVPVGTNERRCGWTDVAEQRELYPTLGKNLQRAGQQTAGSRTIHMLIVPPLNKHDADACHRQLRSQHQTGLPATDDHDVTLSIDSNSES